MTRELELWRDGALTLDDVLQWVRENYVDKPRHPCIGCEGAGCLVCGGTGVDITPIKDRQRTLAYSIHKIYQWSRQGKALESNGLQKIVANDLMGAYRRLDHLHWDNLDLILGYMFSNAPKNWRTFNNRRED